MRVIQKFQLNFLCLTIISLGLMGTASAQRVSDSREIGKTLAMDASGTLELDSKHADIYINSWSRDQLKIDVKIDATGKNARDVDRLLETVTFDINEDGESISIDVWLGPFESQNSWDDHAEFVLKDGTKIQGISEYSIEVNIYLPQRAKVVVDHSFWLY